MYSTRSTSTGELLIWTALRAFQYQWSMSSFALPTHAAQNKQDDTTVTRRSDQLWNTTPQRLGDVRLVKRTDIMSRLSGQSGLCSILSLVPRCCIMLDVNGETGRPSKLSWQQYFTSTSKCAGRGLNLIFRRDGGGLTDDFGEFIRHLGPLTSV